MIRNNKFPLAAILVCLSVVASWGAAETPTPRKTWAELMGRWRMTGQARRASSQGAWTSPATADWAGSPNDRRITIDIPESGTVRTISVRIDGKTGDATGVELQIPGTETRKLVRLAETRDDRFVFEEPGVHGRKVMRLTLTPKTRDRWTGTIEERKPDGKSWTRLQELGMTRQGSTIAVGSGQPVCVVTGGLGEIAVTVNGKTAYVCCSGCRDTLLADPDAFLGAARTSKQSPAGPAGSQSH